MCLEEVQSSGDLNDLMINFVSVVGVKKLNLDGIAWIICTFMIHFVDYTVFFKRSGLWFDFLKGESDPSAGNQQTS